MIQIKANAITFFNPNKKCLYIRHSCCVKIPKLQPKSIPLAHLCHPYSTHFPITQNPAIPYFISLFTVLTKLLRLFIPPSLFSTFCCTKKGHASQCDQFLSFYLKKRGNEFFVKFPLFPNFLNIDKFQHKILASICYLSNTLLNFFLQLCTKKGLQSVNLYKK